MSNSAGAKVIETAVRLACRAPSLHNTQPWLWVSDGPRLDLYLDRNRVLSTDRSMRDAHISCGAVLDHLCVAMAAAGWTANMERFPNPNNPHHLAAVDFTPAEFVTDAQRQRADAILNRRTDRLPFFPPSAWESFEPVLRSMVEHDTVRLDVLTEQMRPRLAEAARLTESLRQYDSVYHSELRWWTAPFEASEGIPYSSLVSATESDRVEVSVAICSARRGNRKGVVEKVNHTAAQRWWRTLADEATVEAAQASVDRFARVRGDARLRATADGRSSVAVAAKAEPLTPAPGAALPGDRGRGPHGLPAGVGVLPWQPLLGAPGTGGRTSQRVASRRG